MFGKFILRLGLVINGIISGGASFFTWNDITDTWDDLGVLTWDDIGP